jgi:diguanylate cyclase (GGDEF)-like protein/PAS domain S-box-containing protein
LDDGADLRARGAEPATRRLLLVEDSAADAELVADCVVGPGYGTAFALTVVERLDAAIARLSLGEIDIVLLDLSLPDSKGLKSVRAVLGHATDVPVVVLTGLDDGAVGEEAVRIGAQDFLVKAELNATSLRRSLRYAIERHGHQTALRVAHATLSEARARFQRAFDSAPIGMALVALDGTFLDVNPSLREMLGYPGRQLLSMSIRDLLHAEDIDAFDATFHQLGRGGEATFRAECRFVALGDRPVWALVAAAIVDDVVGRRAHVVVQAEDITARKDAEARLVHQALHDPLTGLPNRLLFQDRLEHALARLDRRHESVGVFYVDLDAFKVINDSFGHERGDQLLAEVAQRLHRVVRPSDTVARIGGDEFVVLAEGLSGRDEAAEIAARVLSAVASPIVLGDGEVVTSVSVGVALATERHRAPSLLLSEADRAMYRAKDLGKGRFEIFDAQLGPATGHVASQALVRRATTLGRVTVAYQPIIELATSQVVAVEALMRINDPEHGLLRPRDFLVAAEETGLIVPMGHRVLALAVAEAARRLKAGATSSFRAHVNLSARQLCLPGLAADMASVLAMNALAAPHLWLELTEDALVDGSPLVAKSLSELKELGVGLGLDDFGAGYSSLTSLRRAPLDFVKIDTTLVAHLLDSQEDVKTVKALIALVHALGLTTIAEGIENQTQLSLLSDLGCDLGQGHLLGWPQLQPLLADDDASLYIG